MDPNYVDYAKKVDTISVNILDNGNVSIVDFSPRMVPEGRTPEFRIIQGARVSFGQGLKSEETDNNLLQYLLDNGHTSPTELCSITFRIKVPKAQAIQILRHRTAKFAHVNEFSQRYAEVTDDLGTYNPLHWCKGVRLQSTTNKQGSSSDEDENKIDQIKELMIEANKHQQEINQLYHQMIEKGCAKEIARYWLPMSEYTVMYIEFDLNNLTKFLTLRDDSHAQLETVEVARAMHQLAQQIFPITFKNYENFRTGITLLGNEIEALKNKGDTLKCETSKSRNQTYKNKLIKLGITQSTENSQNVETYTPPTHFNPSHVTDVTYYRRYKKEDFYIATALMCSVVSLITIIRKMF